MTTGQELVGFVQSTEVLQGPAGVAVCVAGHAEVGEGVWILVEDGDITTSGVEDGRADDR